MRTVALGLLSFLFTPIAAGQTPNPSPTPDPEGKHSGAPIGQFTVGPFIVTPTFKIGTMAVDTNVFYRRERRADFVASAGPGLDIALPFLDHWKLDLQGSSEYFYFQRTKELRRWTGGGEGALLWKTTGTRASLSTRLAREFSRPSLEVDSRVATNQRFLSAHVERDLGRLTLAADGSYAGTRVEPGQEFRGADLATGLTLDSIRGAVDFRYRLTPISSLLIESGYQESHFPKAVVRNYAEENVGLGLQTAGRITGRVSAGMRRSRLLQGNSVKTQPYLRGDLAQSLGRRFRLTETYSHESTVSAFATDGGLPTFERRAININLSVEITRRIDMHLGGTRERITSGSDVQVVLDSGATVRGKRDDVAYVGRADIGMRLGRARTALFVSYTTRDSQFFSDLGIEGLQMGARVEYAPSK